MGSVLNSFRHYRLNEHRATVEKRPALDSGVILSGAAFRRSEGSRVHAGIADQRPREIPPPAEMRRAFGMTPLWSDPLRIKPN